MKYFTMEELDYIAKEILENPSKETLKRLSEKYNGVEQNSSSINWVESPAINTVATEVENEELKDTKVNNNMQETSNNASGFNIPNFEISPNQGILEIQKPINSENLNTQSFNDELKIQPPVWEPISNTDNTMLFNTSVYDSGSPNQPLTSVDMPNLKAEEKSQDNIIDFEMPKIEPTLSENSIPELQPNNSINNQVPFSGNLWENQTNETSRMMQTTDNFNSTIEVQPSNENPLAQTPFFQTVPSPTNNSIPISEASVAEGPTMFGQFEQNFNNNAA